MNYSSYTTNSGIKINNIFNDSFKTATVSVEFYVSLNAKNASYISLLCAVLKRGNKKYGQMDKICEFLNKNYGASFTISTSKKGDLQRFAISSAFIDDRFTLEGEKVASNIVSLILATLSEPIIDDSFVEQEKRNLIDFIAALINDKRMYSLEKCKQTMFKDDVYGIYEQGDAEVINTITTKGLCDYFKTLLNESMLYIGYAGASCDTKALFKPIIDLLDNGKRPCFTTTVNNTVFDVTYKTEPMNVAQSKLNLGFRLGDNAKDDIFALRMFNEIYGGSPTSKLFNNVRERLSLCYYCASAVDTLKNVMFVYSGIETENYEKAHDEILNQLELMKKGEFSDEEFQNARAGIIDSYTQMGDSLSMLLSNKVFCDMKGIDLTPEEQIEQIKKVTPARVIAIAKQVTLDTVYLLKGVGGDTNAD